MIVIDAFGQPIDRQLYRPGLINHLKDVMAYFRIHSDLLIGALPSRLASTKYDRLLIPSNWTEDNRYLYQNCEPKHNIQNVLKNQPFVVISSKEDQLRGEINR